MRLIEGENQEKKKHLLRLLESGTVMMFIDSRMEEVLIPDDHKNNPQLALNLDYRFDVPDLNITNEKIEVTLSFNQIKHYCEIPFKSIYAIRCEEAEEVVIFLEDLPQKLYAIPNQPVKEEDEIKANSDEKPKPHLVSIESTPEPTPSKKQETKPKKPHLRLIKSED
jgi:stringent starvation protein B